MKICFILDHDLKNYRISFFNRLGGIYNDVTVMHSGKQMTSLNFEQIIVKRYVLGPIEYRDIPTLRKFDVIICMQNIRMINLWSITLNPFRQYKIIHWGIGVSSSNGLSLKKTLMVHLRNFITCFSEGLVLYSEFPITLFSSKNSKKITIAHNTIENPERQDLSHERKDSFLFIGTLNKRKGINELISTFKTYLKLHQPKRISKLVIVGEGPEKKYLKDYTHKLGIEDKVIFLGRIDSPERKTEIFRNAVVSISLRQAGLSVLESFSFGIPFIAYSDAISGGEHLNIENEKNGFLINSQSELVDILIRLDEDPRLGRELGNGAYQHYITKRSMDNMVDAFDKAITRLKSV